MQRRAPRAINSHEADGVLDAVLGGVDAAVPTAMEKGVVRMWAVTKLDALEKRYNSGMRRRTDSAADKRHGYAQRDAST